MTQTPKQPLIRPPSVHCTTMPEVRAQIDALDDVLVPLLVQRIGYMSQAARIKQDAAQVRDEARIQTIVDRVRKQALEEGGQPDVVEAIYRGMMEACIAFEHREFARMRGAAAPATEGEDAIATNPHATTTFVAGAANSAVPRPINSLVSGSTV